MKRSTVSERTLVLAPRGRDAALAIRMLDESGIAAEPCASLSHLLEELDIGAAVVVVTEEALATANLSPLADWIGDQEKWSDLPFVLLMSQGGGIERNPAARRYLDLLGNATFIERPFHPTTLVSLVRAALRGRLRQYEARARLQALHEGEAQFRALATVGSSSVYGMGPDWREMRRLDGAGFLVDTEEPTADWVNKYIPHEEQSRVREAIEQAIRIKGAFELEHRVLRVDGTVGWAFSRAIPLLDGAGEIVEWFGAASDVTARVEADQSFVRLFQASPAPFLVVKPDTPLFTIVEVNDAYLAATMRTREGLVGRALFEAFPDNPDDVTIAGVSTLRASLERALALRRSDALPALQYDIARPDGTFEERWWSPVNSPVLNENGEVEAIIHNANDVTEMRRAEAALRELNETLEQRVSDEVAVRGKTEDALRQAQKMEAVGQLTGGVAHDFNNLLTIIKSSTEFLRRPDLADERRRRYVDAISETVDRAAKLTGQLLAFARRQTLKPEAFDVSDRVNAITDMLGTLVSSRIRIVIEAPEERCVVTADASQFETAIVNIAVNARDAMNGEGTLTLKVAAVTAMPAIRSHAASPGDFVAVSLTDTGGGIPADKLPQIFEPFFTTKEVGKGTGLGLSQVYGFAKQSGGDVAVASEAGRGATFTLYLPRKDAKNAIAASEAPEATEPIEHGDGLRILVVEDNVEVGTFSTQILQDLGYETIWASNADEALKILDEVNGFDAVFSDVVMPGMSGVELGQQIRRRHPGLPVVLTSGYSHVLAEEGRHGFELLQKPYAVDELSRVLHRAMQGRRAGRPSDKTE